MECGQRGPCRRSASTVAAFRSSPAIRKTAGQANRTRNRSWLYPFAERCASAIDRVDQAAQIADHEGLIGDLGLRKDRRMIERKRTGETDVAVRLQCTVHVDVAVVDEGLLKAREFTAHVAEMDHDD